MKFIRKHGRVIPIHDTAEGKERTLKSANAKLKSGVNGFKKEKDHRNTVLKASAVQGAGLAVTAIGVSEGFAGIGKMVRAAKAAGKNSVWLSLHNPKLGVPVAIAAAGYATVLGSGIVGVVHENKANKIRKLPYGERVKENFKQLGSMVGGATTVLAPAIGIAQHATRVKPVVNWAAGAASKFSKRPVRDAAPWKPLRLGK